MPNQRFEVDTRNLGVRGTLRRRHTSFVQASITAEGNIICPTGQTSLKKPFQMERFFLVGELITDLFFKKNDSCAHFLVLLNEIFCDAKDEIGQSPMKFQMQAFEMKSNPLSASADFITK